MAKRSVDAKHTLRELLLLQFLGNHPNVISMHNVSTNLKDDELYIVMDLMDTDLHRVIQSSQSLSDAHVKYFLHQLLRGVKYLHGHGVLHRDLKPGNLLLSKTCQLKVGFALCLVPISSRQMDILGLINM
uniref:Protein kinase domain-containing protein n=1 Tax=Globisporangium ultimum (strain ATCC 200006 / CBS 805.95 / DAOM BR144) TaxID=431595 RepID=K3WFG5_GLOUD